LGQIVSKEFIARAIPARGCVDFLDPSLAAHERAATLSQRFLLAQAAQKVIRQAVSCLIESRGIPESALV
jgi:hypothetical protein